MNTLCTIKTIKADDKIIKSSRLLSGGDEKVLRLFEAPYNYVKSMNNLNPRLRSEQQQLQFSLDHSNEQVEQMIESDAKKQPLGLMNKPTVLLANKGLRVNEAEEGGAGAEFDPITVLSNQKKTIEILKI